MAVCRDNKLTVKRGEKMCVYDVCVFEECEARDR